MNIRGMCSLSTLLRKVVCPRLFRIMQFPRYSIEQADETGLTDTSAEERVRC